MFEVPLFAALQAATGSTPSPSPSPLPTPRVAVSVSGSNVFVAQAAGGPGTTPLGGADFATTFGIGGLTGSTTNALSMPNGPPPTMRGTSLIVDQRIGL